MVPRRDTPPAATGRSAGSRGKPTAGPGHGTGDPAPAGAQHRDSFETMIPVTSTGPYFMVIARDGGGQELGRSQTVRVSSG